MVITREAEVHVRQGQLVVLQDERVTIPTEDIAVLVLEHPRIKMSAAALALLASQGVATAFCDNKHMPTGILLSSNRHSRQLAATRLQLDASIPQQKRLWQRIVQAKVLNQATCLEALSRSGVEKMKGYAESVASGDSTGIEATAARYYFPRLMPGIARHSSKGPDPALDYGYAILRAAIARSLVAHGLYLPLGIRHRSQLNAFNLADDCLEPFRPFVDYVAVLNDCRVGSPADRATLTSVLHMPCQIDGQNHSVLTAIENSAVSLVRALSRKDYKHLSTPSLVANLEFVDRVAG